MSELYSFLDTFEKIRETLCERILPGEVFREITEDDMMKCLEIRLPEWILRFTFYEGESEKHMAAWSVSENMTLLEYTFGSLEVMTGTEPWYGLRHITIMFGPEFTASFDTAMEKRQS